MPHSAAKLLDDIRDAAEFILELTSGRTLAEYESDRVRSDAVERNFVTIGEAFSRLARLDPQVAAALGEYPQIIGFRNVVVHGYDVLEHAIVWGVIQNELPRLLERVREMLRTHPIR
jgi:uncharacterized protein with HEPN domain